jgi:hypothetical protein
MTKGGMKRKGGHNYEKIVGTRAEVWHGTCHHTTGGLTKNDLMKNKNGRIVSKRKHATAKKEKRLLKAGYGTRKGRFGAIKMNRSRSHSRSHSRSRSRSYKGGNGINYSLSPTDYDGQGVGTSGVDLQFVAGNAAS